MDLAPPPADAAPTPLPPRPDESDPPDRIVAGVAAMLAERLDIDALWVRIAFVLLALVGGVGILVYGALWLAFIVGDRPDRQWARLAGGAVLVLGLPLVLTSGFAVLDGPFAVFALLVGLAAALWQPRRAMRPASSSPPAPAAPGAEAEPQAGSVARPGDALADGVWARVPRPRRPHLPRRPPRPPSILGRLTLGIAILVAAGGALIDQANGGRLHPEQWLGAAAIVCAYGLLVGAVFGRALWLVVPAALFAGSGFAAGEAARVGVEPTALVGGRSVYVGEGTSGNQREHVVAGEVEVVIDGTPSAPVTVDARVGVGNLEIRAVDNVTVEVRPDARHGVVELGGMRHAEQPFTLGPEGAPDVIVVARVGRGDIGIRQYPPFRPAIVQPDLPIPVERGSVVADGVVLTSGGRFVLGNGEAVIGADDTVLGGATSVVDQVTSIATSYGEFRLLPGGLLLTPYGELLDLHALRGTAVESTPTVTPPSVVEQAQPTEATAPEVPAPDPVGPTAPVTTTVGG